MEDRVCEFVWAGGAAEAEVALGGCSSDGVFHVFYGIFEDWVGQKEQCFVFFGLELEEVSFCSVLHFIYIFEGD